MAQAEATLPGSDLTGERTQRQTDRELAVAISVLLVEDSADDAELMLRELMRDGFAVRSRRVENADALRSALETNDWHVVLSDYNLPGFNGLEALEVLKKSGRDLPFIVVSGTISDEVAVAVMRAGAHDYLMKNNLTRLGPAVRRELAEAESRRARRRAEIGFEALVENSLQGLAIVKDGLLTYVNPRLAEIVGVPRNELGHYSPEEMTALVHTDDRLQFFERVYGAPVGRETNAHDEVRLLSRSRGTRWVEMLTSRIEVLGETAVQAAFVDITHRKQRELELEAIKALASALRVAGTRAEMLPLLLDQILELLQADGTAIATRNQHSGETWFELARGVWADTVLGHVSEGKSLTAEVFASAEPFVGRSDEVASRLAIPHVAAQTSFLAGVPLIADEHVMGVLWIGRELPVEPEDLRVLSAIADMAASALTRVTLHEETELRLERLHSLRTIDLAITTSRDLGLVFDVLLEQVTLQMGTDAARILHIDRATGDLEQAATHGCLAPNASSDEGLEGLGLAGQVAMTQQIVEIEDLHAATDLTPRDQALVEAGYTSYFGVPLVASGELRGVLELLHRERSCLDVEQRGFFETAAWQAAIAIDNAALVDELSRSNVELAAAYESTLEGWARALELRDHETEGHTRRVTDLMIRLAREFGIEGEELTHMRRGALLHDIGKMAIPDSILLKPGPLDVDEWEIMCRHPEYAAKMLEPIQHLRPALDIPISHHERWDGSGYPQGLSGESVPMAARLFAVIDVWDALRSDRPYRDAWPDEKIMAYLRENSGTRFEPEVVSRFLKLVTELPEAG
jgi:PAS domain S-box-containing protein/putative nucleotidyltransferase with HDIG domain